MPENRSSTRTILVTGAGGFVGSHVVSALLRAGYDVICCGRNEVNLRRHFPTCRVVEYDFTSSLPTEELDSLVRGVSVVINAVGIIQEHGKGTFEAVHRRGPIELFHAAERAGVQRVIQISALGADAQGATTYHQTKRDADEALKTFSLDWVILHPSLIFGRGGRSFAFFSALAASPVLFLPGRGDQLIQPIHVHDLTAGIIRLVASDAVSRVTLPVVGPDPVTFRQFMETIRTWLGLSPGPSVYVPMGIVRLMARIGDILRSDFVNTDTVSMLCRGNTADPSSFAAASGLTPRSLSHALPMGGSGRPEFMAACLTILQPLLVVSIAAVWIGSGLVTLFGFPHQTSEGWLLRVGIPEAWTGVTLVLASLLDILLGVAMFFRRPLRLVLALQLFLIVGFSSILTLQMPELWLHPFGPLLKNLPLFCATVLLWALARRP